MTREGGSRATVKRISALYEFAYVRTCGNVPVISILFNKPLANSLSLFIRHARGRPPAWVDGEVTS